MYAYNIFDDIFTLKNNIDSFFTARKGQTSHINQPYVNLSEEDEKLTVSIVAPGAEEKDINLELLENKLHITYKKRSRENSGNYIRTEREEGDLQKTITLPYRVNSETISASLNNGILTVRLEKSEDAKVKKIEIH